MSDLSTLGGNMKFQNSNWSLKKLIEHRDKIDPRPAFQRGPVWKDGQKQLLIDSILTGYDIPKIYLRQLNGNGPFEYEVADGQQRLTAIQMFVDGKLPLSTIKGEKCDYTGCLFAALPTALQKRFLTFNLTISIVKEASSDEIRELFARLQKGSRLTPPELRNSMPSAIGGVIRAMAVNHKFFKRGPFPFDRHYTDDLLAHAFAIEIYGGSRDVKAPDLAAMYREYKVDAPKEICAQVNKVLKFLDEMQKVHEKCVDTKWGFVDLYWVISKNLGNCPAADQFAQKYIDWEKKRLRYTATPEALLEKSNKENDKSMYDYIKAFQREGATKKNLNIRHEVLSKALLS